MTLNATRLVAIARKELIQLKRDTRSLVLAFGLPVLLLLLFGYAISWDVKDIRFAVLDQTHNWQSRELVNAFRASGSFSLESDLTRPEQIVNLLNRDVVQFVLVIPPGFARGLANGAAPVQAIVDGSDANTATIILAYARAITQIYSTKIQFDGVTQVAPYAADSRVWYNEELLSRNMIVPGLIAVIMMIVAAMLTSLTIAREWERGTMEQLASTPASRAEIVVGKLLPYVAIGLIDVMLCTVLGVVLFDVPLRGSIWLLTGLSTAFLIGSLGLGIFISAVARSQLLASQLAMVLTFLPAFLLSGFMYSIDVMPRLLQVLTYLIPARYFLVVTRGIFLKGVGAQVLFVQGLLMLAFAVIGLGLAILVFRKEIR